MTPQGLVPVVSYHLRREGTGRREYTPGLDAYISLSKARSPT